MQLNLSDTEADTVADVLQMYIEGIEQLVPDLATQSDSESHWQLFNLRKQHADIQSVRMRIVTERQPS
jgi:hypothetical protein